MKNDKNTIKVNSRFQKIWDRFKDQHITEGYKLSSVFDIYLPFWHCKQNIVVEKDVELDRFSRIILELVNNGVISHLEICKFLGIDEDSFVTIQFHFLIKNNLIQEADLDEYEITHQGLSFLDNKFSIKNFETVEFEYFITERMDYLKNDLTEELFNPNLPIDKQLSEEKKRVFSGYQVMQSHKIHKSETSKEIPHNKHRPNFKKISEKRNDFSSFFNRQFKDKLFYDFAEPNMEAHKRNICFLGLLYEDNDENAILNIRQSNKSVIHFSGNNELEKTLSEKATKYYSEFGLK